MRTVIVAPSNYIQGSGEINNIAEYCKKLSATKAYVITGPHVRAKYEDVLVKAFKKGNFPVHIETYRGECCDEEIDRICADLNGADVIIAVGGGKPIDTAKTVASKVNLPVIVVPTSASTDAPCSRMAVIYTKEGVVDRYVFFNKNPDIVLMDLDIICEASARFLASGMGDAMATYYEAVASARTGSVTMAGGVASQTAMMIATLCRDILLEDGVKAYEAVGRHACSQAVENVVEANTYLSGVGFENGGVAAAHSIHNGLTVLEQTHKLLHGEKVAFGVVCQMIMEDRDSEEIDEIISFFRKVKLPVCFKDLGIENVSDKELLEVAKLACAPGETIHNMYIKVTPEYVMNIMKAADAYAQSVK